MPDETDLMFIRMEQERTNENHDEWLRQYGFEHNCRCADDVETGNVGEAPECYLKAAHQAFEGLRSARAVLLAIAEADTDDADLLKQLATEAIYGAPATDDA